LSVAFVAVRNNVHEWKKGALIVAAVEMEGG
jgi:hypothetical protein